MRRSAQHRGGYEHHSALGDVEALGIGLAVDSDLRTVGHGRTFFLSMIAFLITQRSPTLTPGRITDRSMVE